MKYLAQILLSILLLLSVWVGLFVGQLGLPYFQAMPMDLIIDKKIAISESIKQRKVVLIAGSSGMYGNRSDVLQQGWQTPVLNFATHAGLGAKYVLDRSRDVINPGDIVVLPLEWHFYNYRGRRGRMEMNYIISRDPEYFFSMPWKEQLETIFTMEPLRLLRGYEYLYSEKIRQRLERANSNDSYVKNINQHGDRINNEPSKQRAPARRRLSRYKPKLLHRYQVSEEFKAIAREYFSWARDNNVCLAFVPPPLLFHQEYRDRDSARFFSEIKAFLASEKINWFGDPYAHMVPREHIFDSYNHLNSLGALANSRLLLDEIDWPGLSSKACGVMYSSVNS